MKKTFIIVITLTLGLVSAKAQETADEYEQQITAAYVRNDMKTLDEQLASYYKSGLYPLDVLMYNYNEMQGMEDWGVMVMSSAESLIGKLMLQRVLNVHRDKVQLMIYLKASVPHLVGNIQKRGREYEQSIKWVADHADRAVYFPFTDAPLFMQFPDSLKECIYNEGLTMRYATTPYDNIAVKILNLEERYLMDYLKLSLHPYNEQKDKRHYHRFTPGMLALNYSATGTARLSGLTDIPVTIASKGPSLRMAVWRRPGVAAYQKAMQPSRTHRSEPLRKRQPVEKWSE